MSTTVSLAKLEQRRISDASWEEVGWLPCRVTVETGVQGFTLSDLLSLAPGSVVATKTPSSAELMVSVNGQLLGTAELDVIGDRYGVRLSDLAG